MDELDFTDDRLGVLLKYLSKKSYWEKIEKDLSERSIEAYELPVETVRCDATTVSGHHEIEQDCLFQRGVSKDNPKLPQIKIMTGALDPLGMPLASDIVSGEKADDILYRPVIERINEYLTNKGVIYVGDSKMSAVETRIYIKGIDKHYLCPMPQTGNTAKNMELWIKIGIFKDREDELNEVYVKKGDKEKLISKGYEFDRIVSGELDGEKIEWTERVLLVNSPSYAKSQAAGLERRIENAVKKLYALTPQRGPGKRQITDEETLKASIAKILKQHKVEGMLCCKYENEVERKEKYVGKGKGSANRPKRIIERVRYQMLNITRNEYRIKKEKAGQGWKVFVTDVSSDRLDFGAVVKCYRKEYRVERIFNRLKSRMNIAPLYVKRDDQIKGKTHLLTIGARVLTIIEYLARRSLQNDSAKLKGLYPENPGKSTDMPTSEKLLKVFSDINLTFLKSESVITRFLTPLTDLQQEILKRLGLRSSVYKNLEIIKSPAVLSEW
ncbi:IS1634 family transposase [Desulfobacterales bacterium HSG17]|nr:IS1634 family transposase [Desulfobacterales bacterium HSG17]